MLTWDDCVGMCELTPDEIHAIAEHEHIPEMVALEMGSSLIKTTNGVADIKRMIVDDIATAKEHHHLQHATELTQTLQQFVRAHPEIGGAA